MFKLKSIYFCLASLILLFISMNEQGYGQSVAPDGSFNYKVDINIPPGTAGLAPKLAFVYNSNSGNGMLGIGWSLDGIPCITRDNTYPIKYDGNDHYVGPGGRLVSTGNGILHTEDENFSRFEAKDTQGDGPSYWVETKPDGTKYYYGYTEAESASTDSKVWALKSDGTKIQSNGQDCIRTWALSMVMDGHGNYYHVRYIQDNGDYYPHMIIYTQGNGLSKFRTIEFEYESRSDHYSIYSQSAKVETKNRLKKIIINVNVPLVSEYSWINLFTIDILGDLVRKYEFEYADGLTLLDNSRIVKLKEFGSNSGSLPELIFNYNNSLDGGFPPAVKFNLKGSEIYYLGHSNKTVGSILGDFDGDGKTDILRWWGSSNALFLSNGDGTFRPADNFNLKTEKLCLSNGTAGVIPGDFNGDGKMDILKWDDDFNENKLFLSNGDGIFTPAVNFNLTTEYLCHSNRTCGVILGDFNGDGKTDILKWADVTACNALYLSNGDGTFKPVGNFNLTTEYLCHSNGTCGVILGDFNGDGKTDILKWADVTACNALYLSNGNGTFTPAVNFNLTTEYLCHSNRTCGVILGDFNGDGKTDILKWADVTAYNALYLSNGDGTFTPAVNFNLTTEYLCHSNRTCGVTLGDFNGDGKTDILKWADSIDCNNLFLSNYSQSNVLVSIVNSFGSTASVTSNPAPQVNDSIVSSSSSYPCISNTAPRNLVTNITTTDGRGASYSTSYEYYNGKIYMGYPYERKNLLFEKFTQKNDVTGQKTITYFKQDDKKFACRPTSTEEYAGDGTLVKKTTNTCDAVTSIFNTNFVRLLSVSTDTYQAGTFGANQTRTITYDDYGNPKTIIETATGLDTITTAATYTQDTTNWILNKPTEIKKQNGSGNVIQWQKFDYSNGNMVSKQDYLNTGGRWLTTTFTYDPWGNMEAVTDPLEKVTRIVYEEDYHTFVTKKINYIGQGTQETAYEYDARFGVKVSETDPNGNKTVNEYDQFGRLTKVIEPGDTWTKIISYNNFGDPNAQYIETQVKDDSVDEYSYSRSYFDGMNREYKKVSKAEKSGSDLYEMVVEKTYDAAGRLYKESNPYMLGAGCDAGQVYYTTFEYDTTGRLTKKTHPEGSGAIYETMSYTYNDGKLRITIVDPKGVSRIADYDARNNLRKREDPLNAKISYEYDGLGRLTRTVDLDGKETTITYDTLGRKTAMSDPNKGSLSYTYDDNGNLKTQTDAKGQTITFDYDGLNRIIKESSTEGPFDVTYEYDDTTMTYAIGRLTKVTDGAGVITYSYDKKGNQTSSIRTIDGMSFAIGMEYDTQKRLRYLTYPDGKKVERIYSDAGYLEAVKMDNGALVQYGKKADSTGSWCYKNIITRRTGNGVETTIEFEQSSHRPLSVFTRKAELILEDVSYYYDDATGNINKIEDNLNSNMTENFTYDDLNRLRSANSIIYGNRVYIFGSQGQGQGNLMSKDGTALQYTDTLHPHAVTVFGDKTYSYDANGNMTLRQGKTLKYDVKDRLVSIWNGTNKLEEYAYDYTGFRIKKLLEDGSALYNISGLYEVLKKADGTTSSAKYVYGIEGDLVAKMTLASGTGLSSGIFGIMKNMYNWKNPLGFTLMVYAMLSDLCSHPENYRYLMMGLMFLAMAGAISLLVYNRVRRKEFAFPGLVWARNIIPIMLVIFFAAFGFSGCQFPLFENSTTVANYFHPNHIGSVRLITDSSGSKIAEYKYGPYGELLTSSSSGTEQSKYKYTRQEEDSSTGLYYYKARFYDPEIGRFISADSVIPNQKDTQAFNRYMYVLGNPISYMDSTGHGFGSWFKKTLKSMLPWWPAYKAYKEGGTGGLLVYFGSSVVGNITKSYSIYSSFSYTKEGGWGITLGYDHTSQYGEFAAGGHWQERGFNKGHSLFTSYGYESNGGFVGASTSVNLANGNVTESVGVGYGGAYGCAQVGYTVIFHPNFNDLNKTKLIYHGPYFSAKIDLHFEENIESTMSSNGRPDTIYTHVLYCGTYSIHSFSFNNWNGDIPYTNISILDSSRYDYRKDLGWRWGFNADRNELYF